MMVEETNWVKNYPRNNETNAEIKKEGKKRRESYESKRQALNEMDL